MCDLLEAVLEDLASDLGLVLPPAPPTSDHPHFSYESPLKQRHSPPQPHPNPLTPSSPSSSSHPTHHPRQLLSPFASPSSSSTPSSSKRPRLSSAPSDFLAPLPHHVTPIKAEVDAVLSSLVRRSPRQHPEPSLPLSEQLAHARRTSGRQSSSASATSHLSPTSPYPRTSATPSKPPFHRSPARTNARPAYLTPQASEEGRREAAAKRAGEGRRRYSDGVRSSSRRFQDALLAVQGGQGRTDSGGGVEEGSLFPAVRVVEAEAVSGVGQGWLALSASSGSAPSSPAELVGEVDEDHLTVPGVCREEREPVVQVKGKRRRTRSSASSSKALF